MNKLNMIKKLDPKAVDYEEITLTELQKLLAEKHGARFVTIVTLTKPDMRRDVDPKTRETRNPFWDILGKVSRVNGIVNANYAAAVNRQRAKEGKESDFVPEERSWGTKHKGLPFVSLVRSDGAHELYLEVKVERSLGHEYRNLELGDIVLEADIEKYLTKKAKATRQGVEDEIVLRTYNVKHILSIVIDKQGYVIADA